jgi:DNA-directed RNA polymerase specialized sigma24 family protein
MEELDYRQIADIVGTSESTARVQVRDARESLRQAMLKRNPRWTGEKKPPESAREE